LGVSTEMECDALIPESALKTSTWAFGVPV